jgi:hypothetical protein
MLPRSKCQIYVGYDDGLKSVKFYNAETRKVLISRNYKMINLPRNPESPETISITPDSPNPRHEGEIGGKDMPQSGESSGEPNKQRCTIHEEVDVDEPQQMTWGIRTDYKRLQDPHKYPQEADYLEEEDSFLIDEDKTYAIIAGDELTSLKEAMDSPDWPTWHKSMDVELQALAEKETWELVEKPPDAVLLPNKWTFVKKRNKEGEVVRHRAWLVAKGCAERPGYDYIETYSPMVWMDSLHAILSLVPVMDLKVQQMDIKGAYHNGILQETIYMKQPEGCEDGTNRVCKLLKTMYGLKQAGRKWNKQLDEKFKK